MVKVDKIIDYRHTLPHFARCRSRSKKFGLNKQDAANGV